MKALARYSLTLVFFLIFSCSLFENEQGENIVHAFVEGDRLVINNNTPIDMYYNAVNKNKLALMYWAPTVTEANRIKPGASVSIAVDDILENDREAPIAVYYWDEDINKIFQIDVE